MTQSVHVISFGYGHTGALADDGHTVLTPPTADITLDLRRSLYNPHHDPSLRYLTGLDETVYQHVMATPGARLLAHTAAATAHLLMGQVRPSSVTVATGCAGGRHRAVAVARAVHSRLAQLAPAGGYQTVLVHRDVRRPVLPSSKHR